ncbi:hypothetical protein JCM19294_963 [Nonlabens tegetincola]|uniref:Phosphopeptide-binding protein n=1 Tax=Nonlabens tegetincola TaxID=323273 RepID=A0A090Q0P7_9FLAO|nr:hypothetical protein [Nonlabens tegetincola]GAK96654.1 hypothetical protein JCM19294_963 [Nonlabens tegetincola]
MNIKKYRIAAIGLALTATTLIACKESPKSEESEEMLSEEAMVEQELPSITIEKLMDSPAYETASLSLKSPDVSETIPSGETNFDFEVTNYELGAITDSENANRLANSGKGQHIHFIVNNQPYSAHYEPTFTKALPDGTHHLVAFLSRSYHESVKNNNSVVVKKVQVGDEITQELDMDAPTLIYSRPKGEYSGKDTENLLLDFFVINTTLSEDGNKVRATINDEVFTIIEWAPYIVKGLPMGEVSIKLELVDDNNQVIPGPFNSVTRTVTLKE